MLDNLVNDVIEQLQLQHYDTPSDKQLLTNIVTRGYKSLRTYVNDLPSIDDVERVDKITELLNDDAIQDYIIDYVAFRLNNWSMDTFKENTKSTQLDIIFRYGITEDLDYVEE